MSKEGFIQREIDILKEKMHVDPLEPRTWECEPLLVIERDTRGVAFFGKTNVEVTPHADGTSDLVADSEHEGWHPNLKNAKFTTNYPVSHDVRGQSMQVASNGIYCEGSGSDGIAYEWYIGGASDAWGERRLQDFGETLGPLKMRTRLPPADDDSK